MLEGLRDEFNQKLRAVSTSLFAALRREEDARLDAEVRVHFEIQVWTQC